MFSIMKGGGENIQRQQRFHEFFTDVTKIQRFHEMFHKCVTMNERGENIQRFYEIGTVVTKNERRENSTFSLVRILFIYLYKFRE